MMLRDPFPSVARDGSCPQCGKPIFQNGDPPFEWYCGDWLWTRVFQPQEDGCKWNSPREQAMNDKEPAGR